MSRIIAAIVTENRQCGLDRLSADEKCRHLKPICALGNDLRFRESLKASKSNSILGTIPTTGGSRSKGKADISLAAKMADRARHSALACGERVRRPTADDAWLRSGTRKPTTREWRYDPRNPQNHSIHVVTAGETLAAIAKRRRGVSVTDLAWLNGIHKDGVLRVGQKIKLPHQSFLDAGRDAKNTFLALDLYMRTHEGKLPPNVAKPPSIEEQVRAIARTERKNGYRFGIDIVERTQLVSGDLLLKLERRSQRNQLAAGKPDRLPHDDGGHFIAVRFNGPHDWFNHYAQERGFNRGGYRALEDTWAKELKVGKRVSVTIDPEYQGLSRRPSHIVVTWTINGQTRTKRFENGKGK